MYTLPSYFYQTPTKQAQRKVVLDHLTTKGNITDSMARSVYGIARLSARVHELKAAGHPIKSTLVRSGKCSHYSVYSI